ncbi:MAG TPA: DUF2314 domain-containing protein [Thermoanaerobaculia bacterium]|nr:DUF2314 domain-containing protein [Thermoanaerobaculia bacterium]
MPKNRWPPLLLGLWTFALSACAPAEVTVPPGPALEESMAFEFALFYTGPPREDPRPALDGLLAHDFPGFTRVKEIGQEKIGGRRELAAVWVTDARQSYAAPGLEGLQSAGRGLDGAQAEALQQSDQVLRLLFRHGGEHRWSGMREALRLTSAFARQTGGLIWDEVTREMFTPEAWEQRRIAPWPEAGLPDLKRHFTVHIDPKENGYRRAVSLGLEKFGLPDLVVEDLSGSSKTDVGNLINLLAQALGEGKAVGSRGEFDLDLRSLGPSETRDDNLESLAANATAKARLRLAQGTWKEGDPENRLFEILFDRYEGPDLQARQDRLLSELFGSEDSFAKVEHDAKVLAASRQAQEKLAAALKPAFQAGLPPGEILLVKAPFPSPEGREWMWVEVIEWQGDRISGTLQNDPVEATHLKSGQKVEVSEADVFDYLHRFPDGTEEGNETAKYLYPEG